MPKTDARPKPPPDLFVRLRDHTPQTPGDLVATAHHAAGLTSPEITGMGLTPAGRVIEELF